MVFNSLSPIIYTNDLIKSLEFYKDFLGFEMIAYSEDWQWAKFRKGKAEIMISTPGDHMEMEKPVFTGSIYFYMSGVEEWWKELKDSANICYPLEKFEYGMYEFAIFDVNGYILQFGEELDGI